MLQPSYCENIIVGVKYKHKLYENIKTQYEELSFSQKRFLSFTVVVFSSTRIISS